LLIPSKSRKRGEIWNNRPSDNEGVQNGHACLSLSPESLETPGGNAGVVDGVLGVAMAKVILD
jgi:hypothetical protein